MSSKKFGIQSKLFSYFMVIIFVTIVGCGYVIEEVLVYWRMENIQKNLVRYMQTIELMVREIPAEAYHERYPLLAKKLGGVLGMRVTFFDKDGRVVGDSAVPLAKLPQVEEQTVWPEVGGTLAHVTDAVAGYPETISKNLFCMTHALEQGNSQVVVRLEHPLNELQNEISQLRHMVVYSVLVAMAMAAMMSGLASRMATKSLRVLVAQAMRITGGDWQERPLMTPSFNTVLTHLEQLMATMSLERDRLKTVLEGVLDAVIAVDSLGRITIINQVAMDLLRVRVTPISRYLEEILPHDQPGGVLRPPYQGDVHKGEILLRGHKNIRVQVTWVPIASDRGCIVLMRDVTERHRLQQIQRDFVASASHELRTPVSIIRLNAETVLDGAFEDPQMTLQLVEAIMRQSLRLSQLISDLLDLSRLESGSHQLKMAMIQPCYVVYRVVDALSHLVEERGIQLIVQLDEAMEVYADASALEQVITNLANNAIKYTPVGGRVVIGAETPQEGEVRLQVTDNGPGISAEHHPMLFRRFYRVDPGRSRDVGGTGLGLSIVKHLVGAMGGQVGLDMVNPHGCCFWFTIKTGPPPMQAVAA